MFNKINNIWNCGFTDILEHPSQGKFSLTRIPLQKKELLQAWDAADEYLLNYLAVEIKPKSDSKILVINDSYGALAVALNEFNISCMSDSLLSHLATRQNLALNSLSGSKVEYLTSLETPQKSFDLILIKIPETLALLEDQLNRIKSSITPKTRIIAAAMIKNMPGTVWKIIERIIGSTTTSKAKKKARLIFITPDLERKILPCPYPVYYQLEHTNYQICNHANVFSRDSLDIGTRFLLNNLPKIPSAKEIIDLGCGNGVVGLMLYENHPSATIHFVDESYMAIASAKETFSYAFGTSDRAIFHVKDTLADFEDNSADLIVCNPPFHQQHAIGNQIALNMFKQSFKVLREGGELWVIGNSHLNYHRILKKLFQDASIVTSNSKFIICKAIV